ncbi:Spore germination protein GerE [Acaryochloris thomasi RCC1774]|uniref:Spore germination protein GerE n=1 Tax=Acaryochloris thomasi RCC1774 TaxID=1764569 RepID=A0A2W1J6X5_9CYAN|nr:GAF domain-containing protein [Acaryochloris thomasi]PZD70300.1 Spore germination protein GerE [Acaryochloris thomasi RCC1774]
MLNNTMLVWDLEQANKISQQFSTSLDTEKIARFATQGIVEQFDCAFARIWLVEPDRNRLKLVASSGLYTRIDGSYSRIPMGAFKIGRIAQNRVSLLSNNLADESWVRDPDWAIANNLKGFAGYPLANADRVIGVLAVFSHRPMEAEFLKILSSLCTTLTVALDLASLHQQKVQTLDTQQTKNTLVDFSLSDNLAYIMGQTTLTVLGTERRLELSQSQVFLKAAEILKALDCTYCRLTYGSESIVLDAIASASIPAQEQAEWERSTFGHLSLVASCFGGVLKINTENSIKAIQFSLTFASSISRSGLSLRIQCASPLLQMGFTQLAYSAGLIVCNHDDQRIPLLTDQASLAESCDNDRVLWVDHSAAAPHQAKAHVSLSITPDQLQEAVENVTRGETWGLSGDASGKQTLSNREQEVIALLVQGFRDRDVAEKLYISDSTVKFHINNIVAKLEAKTRLQALYNLMLSNGVNI